MGLSPGLDLSAAEQVRSSHADGNNFGPRHGHSPFFLAQAESTLALRFVEVARAHSTKTALMLADERRVSYSELLDRSLRIATGLLAAIPRPHCAVGILIDSPADGVEAILGALLAGFSYLPIDASLKQPHLYRVFEAAQPAALIANASLSNRQPDFNVPRLNLAELRLNAPAGSVAAAGPEQPAALFATSGTTGNPKIVALSHRAILFDIGRQTNDLYLGPDDRFDLLFSLGFSASLAPLFGVLLNGADFHPLDLRSRPARLLDWIEAREITVSSMTTSTFRMAVATAGEAEGRCPRLRLLSLGGESVFGCDVAAFRARFSCNCVLQNAAASTETRTYAQYFVAGATASVSDPAPIGWPVWGKEVRLLGSSGETIGGAGEGEVAVVSRYLADGYVNHEAQTQQRFHREPDGRTLFRTGDRARRSEDGCLTFL